ncbi:MAG: hypothetical protein PHI98_13440 [Eubacteriales bacterium]|nr:hypothetical protein [Eubacteriales bacterium]
MLGAAGALICMAAGTALGMTIRERRCARLRLLEGEIDALARLRLLLLEERFGLCRLMAECAVGEEEVFSQRLRLTGQALEQEPLLGLQGAYELACRKAYAPYEQAGEKKVMEGLFSQLDSGTTAMREQAVSSTMRRLKPMSEQARAKAESGGKLCMQLGMLLGLMAGIALW